MDDLISRQAAVDALKSHRSLFCEKRVDFLMLSEKDKARVDEIDTCISELLNLPTVKPERKEGKWNRTELYPHRIYCSVCYKTYIKNDELLERWEFPMNYCPNCGAEMEGE